MVYRQVRGCPVCGNRFEAHRAANHSYETCLSCHGMWITYETVMEMIAEMGGTELPLLPRTDTSGTRTCPDCDRPMIQRFVFGIPVDGCEQRAHGLWFDDDELRQVLERAVLGGGNEPAEAPEPFRGLLEDFFARH